MTTVHVTYCCCRGRHGGSWLRGVGSSDSCNGTAPEGYAQSSGHTAVDEDTDSNGSHHTEQDDKQHAETDCQSILC